MQKIIIIILLAAFTVVVWLIQTPGRLNISANQTLPDEAELYLAAGFAEDGIASRVLGDVFVVDLKVFELPKPAAGQFYQAWLYKGSSGEPGFDFVSAGKLIGNSDDFYTGHFSTNRNLTAYRKAVVTLEQNADDLPEQHILEGSFK